MTCGNAETAQKGSSTDEIVGTYPYRSRFPSGKWWELFSNATEHIDLLGHALYFARESILSEPLILVTRTTRCSTFVPAAVV